MLSDIRPNVRLGQLRRWILEPADIFLVVNCSDDKDSKCVILETGQAKEYSKTAIVFQSVVISDVKE